MKRKWIDLLLFYTSVIIVISSIVLYIMPHGRVAYWSEWTFLGLNKDEWDNVHVMFGILMVVAAVWHTVVNWKVMKKYLMQKESVIAFCITVLILLGTVYSIEPFNRVFVLQEKIKNSWEIKTHSPQIAEQPLTGNGFGYGRETLENICRQYRLSNTQCLNVLRKHGIKASLKDTLRDVAFKNNIRPVEVIDAIMGKDGESGERR